MPKLPKTTLIPKKPLKWTARFNRQEDQDLGLWAQSLVNYKHGKWLFEFDVNPRVQYNITRLNQLFLRTYLGYRVRPWATVWIGCFPWAPTFEPQYVNEQRLFQQVAIEQARGKFVYSLRARLDERIIDHIDEASVRIRVMPRINYFIDEAKSVYVFTADEPFVNLNTVSNGIRKGLAQNRFYAGVGFGLSKHQRFEVAYLNQWLQQKSPTSVLPNRINHNIVLNLISTF